MCGIVGYVGPRPALEILLDGLKRLEYRGYDSAGVVVLNGRGLVAEKAPGKIASLEARLRGRALHGGTGLGHTRWATHGGVTRSNAHPHFSCDRRVAVVHNGIIENCDALRRALAGHAFRSQTDTEVIPHLIERFLPEVGGDPLRAVARAVREMSGSFAVGVAFADRPGFLVAARANCPLVLGLGEGENFLASDPSALLPHTRRIVPLEEGELATLDASGVRLFDRALRPVSRAPLRIDWEAEGAAKGGYAHFMLKEIHEQPQTLAAEFAGREEGLGGELDLPVGRLKRVVLAGCGTAWHAALVGKVAVEELAGLPAEAGLSSELRYGDSPFGPETLVVAISQSG
ncbi:MAG TPA: isomerizing glutamine--fructose-6-phosphate transaminase, partial [Planctomycetota bacterium]|nr:isomerizing glutamine--fructose-6-phosphate transaminase [Planctomycetota bacterium]